MRKSRGTSWIISGALVCAAGLVASTPAHASSFATAQAHTYSEGAYVGATDGYMASQANGAQFTAEVRAADSAIVVTWVNGSISTALTLVGPSNAPITVGTYLNASSGYEHESWRPQLDLVMNDRRCGRVTNSNFTVHRLETGPGNSVTTLDVSFDHRCPHEYAYWGGTLGRVMLNVTPPPIGQWDLPRAYYADGLPDDPTRVRVAARGFGAMSVTARVFSVATGQEVGSTSNFVVEQRPNAGTYVSSDRLPITEPGLYRIDTTVTDGRGTQVQQGIGYVAANNRSVVEGLGLDRAEIDFDHRTATLSGSLKRKQLGTGQLSPIDAATVTLRAPGNRFLATLVTGADGSFSHPLTQPETVFVAYSGDPLNNLTGVESSPITLGIRRSAIRIAYDSNPLWAPTGAGTVSGKVTFEHGPQWESLAGVQVELQDRGAVVGTATTADDGRFEAAFGPLNSWVTYLSVVVKATDPFLLPPSAWITLERYRSDGDFALFTGFWETETTVTWLGVMEFPGPQPSRVPVNLQYRYPGESTWTTVATIDAIWWNEAWYFETTVPVPCLAEWRGAYAIETSSPRASQPISVKRFCSARRPAPTDLRPVPPRRR